MYRLAVCTSNYDLLNEIKTILYGDLKAIGIKYISFPLSNLDELKKYLLDKKFFFNIIVIDIDSYSKDDLLKINDLRRKGLRSSIIYISDFENRAYEVINTDVFKYILKSQYKKELPLAVISDYKTNYQQKYIIIKYSGITKKTKISEVVYMETCKRGSNVFFSDSEHVYTSIKLSELLESIPQDIFYRCHFSFIVNLQKLVAVKRYEAIMDNGMCVPISKKRYEDFKSRFLSLLD